MNPRVRWMSANQDVTGYPDGTRLNSVLKVGELKRPNHPVEYAWLSEHDTKYKAITTQHMNGLVPTVERIFSDFKLTKLMQSTLPDDALVDMLLQGDVVPSTTSVPGFLFRDDGLQRWKAGLQMDRLYQSLSEWPASDEDWQTLKQAALNYEDTSYAERGTRWHTAIERHLKGSEIDLPPEELEAFHIAMPTIEAFLEGLPAGDMERSFIHPDGYGGSVDFRVGNIVLDWKTKDKKLLTNAGGLYATIKQPEYATQLAAYAKGLKVDRPRLINVFVNVLTGEVAIYEYADPDHARLTWEAMLYTWQLKISNQLTAGRTIKHHEE